MVNRDIAKDSTMRTAIIFAILAVVLVIAFSSTASGDERMRFFVVILAIYITYFNCIGNYLFVL